MEVGQRRIFIIVLNVILFASFAVGFLINVNKPLSTVVALLFLGAAILLYHRHSISSPATITVMLILTLFRPSPSHSLFLGNRLIDLFVFILAILLHFKLMRSEKRRWRFGLEEGIFIAFTFLIAISLLNSVFLLPEVNPTSDALTAFRNYAELIRYPLYLLIFGLGARLSLTSKQLQKHVTRPYLIGATMVCVLGFVFLFFKSWIEPFAGLIWDLGKTTGSLSNTGLVRFTSTFFNPNWYGIFLSFNITLSLAMIFFNNDKRVRLWAWILLLISIPSVFVTGSLTSLIVMFIGGAYMITRVLMKSTRVKRTERARPIWGSVILLLLALAILQLSLGEQLWGLQRVSRHVDYLVKEGITSTSISLRYVKSKLLFERTLTTSPVIGFGPAKGYSIEIAGVDEYLAENAMVNTFFNYGAVGLLLLITIFVTFYLRTAQLIKLSKDPTVVSFAFGFQGIVVVFAVAQIGGEFINSRQLAELFILLAGVNVGLLRDSLRNHKVEGSKRNSVT